MGYVRMRIVHGTTRPGECIVGGTVPSGECIVQGIAPPGAEAPGYYLSIAPPGRICFIDHHSSIIYSPTPLPPLPTALQPLLYTPGACFVSPDSTSPPTGSLADERGDFNMNSHPSSHQAKRQEEY